MEAHVLTSSVQTVSERSKDECQQPPGYTEFLIIVNKSVSISGREGGRSRDWKTSRRIEIYVNCGPYLIDYAEVVDETDADNCDALLFAQHAAGDQGNRHSYPAPTLSVEYWKRSRK